MAPTPSYVCSLAYVANEEFVVFSELMEVAEKGNEAFGEFLSQKEFTKRFTDSIERSKFGKDTINEKIRIWSQKEC